MGDLLCFVLSLVVGYVLICVDFSRLRERGLLGHPITAETFTATWEDADHWTGHAAIYWARVVYALLSLPFLFFWLPGLQGVLTHTRMTGYNQNGACVPYTLRA